MCRDVGGTRFICSKNMQKWLMEGEFCCFHMTLCVVGDLLLSGGRDARIRVWDLDVKCCRRTLPGHTADVLHLAALTPTYSWPATDAQTHGPPQATPEGETDLPPPKVSLTDDNLPRVLSSCSADGTCRLWDVRTWTCVKIISPSAGECCSCANTGFCS